MNISNLLKLGFITLALTLSGMGQASAHLVSYEGGSEVMLESMGSMRSQLSVIYSPKWWLGMGLVYDRINPTDTEKMDAYTTQVAVLLKRWNLPDAQGNFYLHLGAGHLQHRSLTSSHDEFVIKYGLRADYETRRIYTALEYFSIAGVDSDSEKNQWVESLMFSLGVAPYIAQYEDFNTWFIAKVMWRNDFKNVEIFPTARFFFKNVLWEVGQSLNGETLFSFMMRY